MYRLLLEVRSLLLFLIRLLLRAEPALTRFALRSQYHRIMNRDDSNPASMDL